MYVPAYINLADLYRSTGDEAAAEKVLRQAARLSSENGDLHYALGLSLIRQKRAPAAVEELRLAARLDPDNPRYTYVYAVALNSTDQPEQAIMELKRAHNSHPNDVDILNALTAFLRDAGGHEQAKSYSQKLRRLSP
jgi:Tfp pilus assembly protein PilF